VKLKSVIFLTQSLSILSNLYQYYPIFINIIQSLSNLINHVQYSPTLKVCLCCHREAEKRTQRKKKIVARSSSTVSMKGAASPRLRKRSSAAQINNELQGRILDLESLVREMYIQGEEMREKVTRLEEGLAQVLGQKSPVNDKAGSQYQSAEQLIDVDVDHQAISYHAIMDQQRSILDHNEDEEEVKQRDPFNIPEEEEFFIARQTFRTPANQSNLKNGALFGCPLLEQKLE